MITLAQIGLEGLRRKIEQQDHEEMIMSIPGTSTDLGVRLPGPLGRGGALTRKADAQQRLLIDQEEHHSLIVQEIWRLYNTEDGKREVAKHVRITRNVQRRLTDALAVVYEREPQRLFGPGGSPVMARAWRETVLVEGKLNQQAEQWARHAFFMNLIHVIPQVRDDRLEYEAVLPHASDVVFDDGDREPSILTYLSDGAGWARVAVDNERYWFMDESWKLVHEFRHGYLDLSGRPMQPWIQWRARPRLTTTDYWQRRVGRQLVDATLDVGVIAAGMRRTRQVNQGKLTSLTAPRLHEDVPPGQQMAPEKTLMLRQGQLEVHDMETAVKEFVDHIESEFEEISQSYGVTRGVVDRGKSADRFEDHESVARQRERQIKMFHAADIETQVKTAIILRAERHPATRRLNPRRVAANIELKFPKLSFLQRPKDRFEAYVAELSLGLADHVDLRQREHPDEDAATAEERVERTIDRRNDFANKLAIRNLPADAGLDGENLAQRQGRQGGQATPDGDDDERRQQPQQ